MIDENRDAGILCVATPAVQHKVVVDYGVQAGLNIFCEKPLAETFPEAEQMVGSARSRGLAFTTCFKMRYEKVFAEAKRAIKDRRLGKVRYFLLNYFQPFPDIPAYLDDGFIAGGMVHPFDLANWFLEARPESVSASSDMLFAGKGEDLAFLELCYDEKRRAILNGGYVDEYPEIAGKEDIVFELVCDHGFILGKRPDFLLVRDRSGSESREIAPQNAFADLWADFLKAVEERREPPVSPEDGLSTQLLVQEAVRSARDQGARRILDWQLICS